MTLPPSLRDWPADALEAWREREAIMWADGVPRSEVAAFVEVTFSGTAWVLTGYGTL